jgi:hypothetical protein
VRARAGGHGPTRRLSIGTSLVPTLDALQLAKGQAVATASGDSRTLAHATDSFPERRNIEPCLQNVRCCLLLRKKPCPEGLLRHVNPATRDVQRKKPTLSVCPYRSTLTGDDPKGLVLTSTRANWFTLTNHRRDGFSAPRPLDEPLNRLRWIPQVTLP